MFNIHKRGQLYNMLEFKVEDQCCRAVENIGGMAIKLKNPGFRGLPDRLILLPGRGAFFVEFKRPKVGRLSIQQKKIIPKIEALGFPVYIIDDLETFEAILAKEK